MVESSPLGRLEIKDGDQGQRPPPSSPAPPPPPPGGGCGRISGPKEGAVDGGSRTVVSGFRLRCIQVAGVGEGLQCRPPEAKAGVAEPGVDLRRPGTLLWSNRGHAKGCVVRKRNRILSRTRLQITFSRIGKVFGFYGEWQRFVPAAWSAQARTFRVRMDLPIVKRR